MPVLVLMARSYPLPACFFNTIKHATRHAGYGRAHSQLSKEINAVLFNGACKKTVQIKFIIRVF